MSFKTNETSMLDGQNGYTVEPLLTIGETIPNTTGRFNGERGDYTPVGLLDGIGAYKLDDNTVRAFVNHELTPAEGKSYTINQTVDAIPDLELTGARISYFDIDVNTHSIVDAGLAYDFIFDLEGKLVTDLDQLDTDPTDDASVAGLNRFCSATLIEPLQFDGGRGLTDRIFFAPSEDDNGVYWALDTEYGGLWAAPALGRGAWENMTELDTGDAGKVAFLLGDDDWPANLVYLYVGEKDTSEDAGFLARNGLEGGDLYAWAPDANRDLDPTNDLFVNNFSLSGEVAGSFVKLTGYDPDMAGAKGYDEFGYALQDTLRAEAEDLGAMFFARTEDLATNPEDGSEAVFATTGTEFSGVTINGVPLIVEEGKEAQAANLAGRLYTVDVDFSDMDALNASMTVLYDGDTAAPNPANAPLRSPDNLDWADNGFIFVQEDEAAVEFGDSGNPTEAQIVKIDPTLSQGDEGFITQIGVINRSVVVPAGVTDNDAADVGEWETSGILDVAELFGKTEGELLLFDVQAHTLENGTIAELGLAESGQLSFLIA